MTASLSGQRCGACDELNVSVRTVYRDITSLQAQGAQIDGERGIGYVLRPGFVLPPLMFTDEEIEALVLGTRWVARQTDDCLALAAGNALAKIASVLPRDLRDELESSARMIGPREPLGTDENAHLASIRQAIRTERKLSIAYVDIGENAGERTIWPFALGFFEKVRVVAAWCELRADYRHFRVDRIRSATMDEAKYPRRRQSLLGEWRKRRAIPEQ